MQRPPVEHRLEIEIEWKDIFEVAQTESSQRRTRDQRHGHAVKLHAEILVRFSFENSAQADESFEQRAAAQRQQREGNEQKGNADRRVAVLLAEQSVEPPVGEAAENRDHHASAG